MTLGGIGDFLARGVLKILGGGGGRIGVSQQRGTTIWRGGLKEIGTPLKIQQELPKTATLTDAEGGRSDPKLVPPPAHIGSQGAEGGSNVAFGAEIPPPWRSARTKS